MERSNNRETEEDEKKKNPYLELKNKLGELLADYYWDDENLCMFPEYLRKTSLPVAECDLSLVYYPGYYVYLMKDSNNVNPPSPRLELLLHALFEIGKRVKGGFINTKGFTLAEEILQKLKQYAPKVNSTSGGLYEGKTKNLARSEMVKHLPSIPFLTRDSYWIFATDAYEKFQMGSLIKFIMEEGKKRHLLAAADPLTHSGWSTMTFRSLIRLAHLYPPIKSSGAQLSFRVFRTKTGYYLKEVLLGLTSQMEPAERSRSPVIYEDLLGNGNVDVDGDVDGAGDGDGTGDGAGAGYDGLIPFDALLLFKN